jgi:signal peptidase I
MSEAKMANDTDPQRAGDTGQSVPAVVAEPKKEESWLETVKTVVYALLIALVIRTIFFQPFNIPSSSMENTLLVGDYLFVEKFAYGFSRYSLPYGKVFPSVGRIFGSSPARGDVVVFKMPNRESADYGEDFIKRVMGLPGDRIQMLNGQVYLNGKAVPKVRVADYVETDEFGMENHVARYKEMLPGGKSYYVLDRIQNGQADNTPVFTVPPGHYFMMGDNRDNSNDSRAEVGYVPAENLVGKAEIIFFSTNGSAHWWEVWKWPWTVRYGRIPTIID